MTSNQEYLAKREAEYIEKRIANDKHRSKKLARLYQVAINECKKEILAFYARYFSDDTPTLEEAMKAITASESKELIGVKRRVTRLKLLELQLSQIMTNTTKDAEAFLRNEFIQEAIDTAESVAGAAPLNKRDIDEIINHSFKAGDFSDNIWGDKRMLEKAINQGLVSSLVLGEHPTKVARKAAKEINSSFKSMNRVMRTEVGLVQIAQQRKNYDDIGVEYYQNIREPSACDKCKEMGNDYTTIDDAEVFKVSEMERGINAPLFHPNCRCSTIPYIKEDDDMEAFK